MLLSFEHPSAHEHIFLTGSRCDSRFESAKLPAAKRRHPIPIPYDDCSTTLPLMPTLRIDLKYRRAARARCKLKTLIEHAAQTARFILFQIELVLVMIGLLLVQSVRPATLLK